jgi:hypothetical protein
VHCVRLTGPPVLSCSFVPLAGGVGSANPEAATRSEVFCVAVLVDVALQIGAGFSVASEI